MRQMKSPGKFHLHILTNTSERINNMKKLDLNKSVYELTGVS